MEKLPTIILPDGSKPEGSASPLQPSSGRSGEGSADVSPQGGDNSSVSSRRSSGSTGLQREMSGGMSYLCSSLPSRSGSSHLLAAPVSPAAVAAAAACAGIGGGMPAVPLAEAVPSLVRLASIRLRACKPPLLAEDFYIRRIGMQLLQPPLPPTLLRCFRRSTSSLASRCSPGQHSTATSRSNSSSQRLLDGHSSSEVGSVVNISSNNSGLVRASAGRSSSSSSGRGSSGSSTRAFDSGDGRSRRAATGSSNSSNNSNSKQREWMTTQAFSSGSEAREASDISIDWPTAAAAQQLGEDRRRVRGEEEGAETHAEESRNRLQQEFTSLGERSLSGASGAGRDTATTRTDKREVIEETTAEKAGEEWGAGIREKETEYLHSLASHGEPAAAASPAEWQQRRLGSDSSDAYQRVQKIGSLRLEEEKERRWAFEKKNESSYCVSCCGDAACAKPVAPSFSPTDADKASPGTMECLYKQGHHELVLEITPPLLTPEGAGITPKPYHHLHADVFSRLAFSVSDVNAAQVSLSSHMIRTGAAAQFADVNFAVTCLDLEDFRLRLLQRLSEYNFVRRDGMQQQRHRRTLSRLGSEECPPLGSKPLFHHVELRVRDPAASLAFYQQVLQFRLISKQAIPDFRMTLYFLTTDSTATPPQQAELDSHANRSWLWEQAFSSICLKAYNDAGHRAQLRPYEELQPHECGFLGFTLICKQMNEQELLASLTGAGVPFSKGRDPVYAAADVYHLRDPDGIPIRILICDDACGI